MKLFEANRKILWVVLLFICLMGFLLVGAGRSSLTIDNSKGADSIRAEIIKGSQSQKVLVGQGKKKSFVTGVGNYKISISTDAKQTDYYFSLHAFSRKTISPSFEAQKTSGSLGASTNGCSYDSVKLFTFYYPCGDVVSDDVFYTNDGQNTNRLVNLSPDSVLNNVSGSISVINNGQFIRLSTFRSKLYITKLGMPEEKFDAQSVLSIPYKGVVGQSSIATDTSDYASKHFALVSTAEHSLFIFSDSQDSSPQKINLDKVLEWGGQYHTKVSLGNNMAFVFSGAGQEGETAEGPTSTNARPDNQKLALIDLASGKVKKVISIKSDKLVQSMSSNQSGSLLISSVDRTTRMTSMQTVEGSKLKLQPLKLDTNSNVCWKSGSDVAYIDGVNQIFQYNLDTQISHLVYRSPTNNISSLSCLYGKLYLTLIKSNDKQNFYHYMLQDEPISGDRGESLLPIVSDSVHDIASAIIYKNTINVRLIDSNAYDNRNDPSYQRVPGQIEQDKARALNYFRSIGLDVDKFKFIFSY